MRSKLTLIFLCLFSAAAFGQINGLEGGILLGGATVYGDLVETDGPSLKATSFAYGIFGRGYVHSNVALRVNLTHGKFRADDNEYAALSQRGYISNTSFTELSFLADWDILGLRPLSPNASFSARFSPYAFLGVGLTFINPSTDFNLAEKGITETVRKDQDAGDSKAQIALPFGLGVKFKCSQNLSIGFEAGLRATFTDYLDGVSHAGNPDNNDWYGLTGLHIIYHPAKWQPRPLPGN